MVSTDGSISTETERLEESQAAGRGIAEPHTVTLKKDFTEGLPVAH